MKSKVFGTLDRAIGRIVFTLAFLIIYGKLLSDFAQLYVTGHTTHFLWFLGDISANGSQQVGPYNLMGLIFLAVVGYCNMMIWLRLFDAITKPIGRFLSKYEIRRKQKK